MTDTALSLTIPEAGFVLDQSSKSLNQAIDRGEIIAKRRTIKVGTRPRKTASDGSKTAGKKTATGNVVREIGAVELRFLALTTKVGFFSSDGRKRIYQQMRRLPADAHMVKLGPVALELDELDKEIAPRLRRLFELRGSVELKDGMQVVRGTNVPVYAVAALKGKRPEEIRADFPSLSIEQIQTSLDYAKIYPKAGRPYPAQSMKDRIADLAVNGVFDDVTDLEPLSPAMFR